MRAVYVNASVVEVKTSCFILQPVNAYFEMLPLSE